MSGKITPMKAIRAKCLNCCCGSLKEVRLCPAENCPIWPYRFGKKRPMAETSHSLKLPTVKVGVFEAEAASEGN